MENKKLIKEMAKLQVLCVRWIERNSKIEFETYGDLDRILLEGKFTVTYKEGVKNLKKNIENFCKNNYLLEAVSKLEEDINNSEISSLRFGLEPRIKFTDLEKELDMEMLRRKLYMINKMASIKFVAEHLRITESAIKQACQQERLLNTRKVSNTWEVHIPECIKYWNLEEKQGSEY